MSSHRWRFGAPRAHSISDIFPRRHSPRGKRAFEPPPTAHRLANEEGLMNAPFPHHSHHDHHDHHHEPKEENAFTQTNLVSDGFVPAPTIDPNLINPWGLALSVTSPFWVSDNGMGVTTVYTGAGTKVNVGGLDSIAIATPPGQTSPSSPTGDVF